MHLLLVSIALVAPSGALAQTSDSPTIAAVIASSGAPAQISDSITIQPGNLQGGCCPGSASSFFLNVPCGQPLVGNLRFASPQAYTGNYLSGTYDASTPGPACI
jgi:hypothetical protein